MVQFFYGEKFVTLDTDTKRDVSSLLDFAFDTYTNGQILKERRDE